MTWFKQTTTVFLCSLIVAVLLLGGLGCKGLSDSERAAIRPVSIDYWTIFGNVQELRRLANAYTAQHPYVTINIRQLRYEEFDDIFVNALADDVGPDIISTHVRWLGKYENRLMPMPDNVTVANLTVQGNYSKEEVVTFQTYAMPRVLDIRNQYVSAVEADIVRNGAVYGLPLAFDSLVLYYNKDLLDQAGIAVPPSTWEEFLDAIKQTVRFDADGDIVQAGVAMGTGQNIANSADMLALLMMQKGVDITRGKAVTFAGRTVNNTGVHPTIEALRFYTDFARPTKEVYTWNTDQGDAFEHFVQGKSVFYFGYAYDGRRIRTRAPQMNMEIISVPQLNLAQPVNVANYWIESVVKKTAQPDIAWDVLRFMSLPENIKAYTEATQAPSPLRVHIAEQQEDPLLSVFASQSLSAQNWYRGRNIDVTNQAFDEFIEGYLAPYPDDLKPEERDTALMVKAVRTIQQTL